VEAPPTSRMHLSHLQRPLIVVSRRGFSCNVAASSERLQRR
jgi:hypothetical protein